MEDAGLIAGYRVELGLDKLGFPIIAMLGTTDSGVRYYGLPDGYELIMVPLFPYLAVRYGVGDIPTTVINGRPAAVGPRDEDAYLTAVLAEA